MNPLYARPSVDDGNSSVRVDISSYIVIRKRRNGQTTFFMLFDVTLERISSDKPSRAYRTGKIRFTNRLVQ